MISGAAPIGIAIGSDGVSQKLDAVFEGGGVRGIGLVGAISVVEAKGYRFENVVGTSAGAIVATLVAAGYSATELKDAINSIDFRRITDLAAPGTIPGIGIALNILTKLGIYEGDYFLGLMRELLGAKKKKFFGDLVMPAYQDDPRYRYKAQVVASDVTRGKMLVLPGHAQDFGIPPDELEIARAARMSMSIPFFFKPVRQESRAPASGTSLIVDGGLLSDFPVELLDAPGVPAWPTFGFRLVEAADPTLARYDITGPISYLKAIIGTATSAHDARYIETHKFVRSILVQTHGIGATAFELGAPEKDLLFQSGVDAATEFLASWDFEAYKAAYRAGMPPPSRRELSALALEPTRPPSALVGQPV